MSNILCTNYAVVFSFYLNTFELFNDEKCVSYANTSLFDFVDIELL